MRLRDHQHQGVSITVWIAVAGLLGLIHTAQPAAAQERITKRQVDANTVVWRIDQPNVRRGATPYKRIVFQGGDRVTVRAGGGVQTGGSGRTWKRYVNPSGPNSDHLYHGLISIPFTTKGLVRIEKIQGRTIIVRNRGKADSLEPDYLILGYEDDDYEDNGYHDHDDGTEDQCKNVGPAFVVVRIEHPHD